ncbi:fungal-specific transcription factor domain-containing protein [Xylaria arbuscula]|nr:fungal-specific transcription factor domain-containing protein [Xylaria arbuscula]
MDSPIDDEYGGTWSSHAANAGGNGQSSGRAAKRRRTDVDVAEAQERGVMREGNEPGLPRFIGSASGIHLIRTVYDMLAQSHVDRDAAADVVPGEEDQLTGPSPSDPRVRGGLPATPFWHPDEIAGSMAAVNFDALLQWTESYFQYWHPVFPFLHGPAFLGVLEQVGENGIESLSQAEAIIVRSVLSISLADCRQIARRRHSFPPDLVFLNQDDIAASLTFVLSSPASIINIQAAMCVELFLISMLNFNMASRVGGIIVRMSFNLGLHRCPSRFPNFSTHDISMRKRLWWSIYCLDRAVCQTLGLPLGIKDDDVDVCLPSEEFHSLGKDATSNGAFLRSEEQCPNEQLELLTMVSKHAKLRGMILELRNKSIRFRRQDTERALRVQAEVKRWINEVYDLTSAHPLPTSSPTESPVRSDPGTSDDNMHPSHRILLVILQHELILSLHRPLLVSDLGTPSSQAAFQECINASRAIIDTASDNSLNLQGGEPSLRDGHLRWPSLTWSIWMSCFVLTYAAIEGITTAVSAKRYANRALRVLKHLSLRKTSWPDKCTLAVEQLIAFLGHSESNKGHLLPAVRRTQRRPSISQSRQNTETSEAPAPHSQALNSDTSQIQVHRHRPRPHQPRLHDQGTTNPQPPNVSPLVGTNFAGTTDTQDFWTPGFTESASNLTFEYENTLGAANHIYADPLIALDFANFAQGPNTQSMMDYNLGMNGFC